MNYTIFSRSATEMRKPVNRNFARLPEENGLTQKTVAERLGFRQQQLIDLEREHHYPTVVTLFELSQALGVNHVELIRPDYKAPWPQSKSHPILGSVLTAADCQCVCHKPIELKILKWDYPKSGLTPSMLAFKKKRGWKRVFDRQSTICFGNIFEMLESGACLRRKRLPRSLGDRSHS